MKVIGFLNLVLLVLNLSALGTIAAKTRFWEKDLSPELIPDTLRLTPGQAQAIELHRESFATDWERIEAELETVRQELLVAIKDDAPVSPKLDEMSRLQARLERQAVEQLLRERDVLSLDQRGQYLSHIEDRMRQGCGCGYRGGRGGNVTPDESGLPRRGGKGRGRGRRVRP